MHVFHSSKVEIINRIFNRQAYSVKGVGFEYKGESYSREYIQTIIAQNDGVIEITPTSTDTIIIAGAKPDLTLSVLMNEGLHDIISFHYILDCIR